ncbi:hypothetical protein CCH79_00008600, partial [Gambusia affinis]
MLKGDRNSQRHDDRDKKNPSSYGRNVRKKTVHSWLHQSSHSITVHKKFYCPDLGLSPPAGRAGVASCPRTQQLRRTERGVGLTQMIAGERHQPQSSCKNRLKRHGNDLWTWFWFTDESFLLGTGINFFNVFSLNRILLICLVQAELAGCSWAKDAHRPQDSNTNSGFPPPDGKLRKFSSNFQSQLKQDFFSPPSVQVQTSSFNTKPAARSGYDRKPSTSSLTQPPSQPVQSSGRLVKTTVRSKPKSQSTLPAQQSPRVSQREGYSFRPASYMDASSYWQKGSSATLFSPVGPGPRSSIRMQTFAKGRARKVPSGRASQVMRILHICISDDVAKDLIRPVNRSTHLSWRPLQLLQSSLEPLGTKGQSRSHIGLPHHDLRGQWRPILTSPVFIQPPNGLSSSCPIDTKRIQSAGQCTLSYAWVPICSFLPVSFH